MARKNNRRRIRTEALPYPDAILPTPEQLRNGDYQPARLPDPTGGNRIAAAYVNRGGTPVTRWEASGKLSDTQVRAIDFCQRLWNITGMTARVTANYGQNCAGEAVESENQAIRYLDAKNDLKRVEGYFTGLRAWWDVFEQVCRHGEPAGVAGSRLGYGERSAEYRAHTTVCFVSDFIAMQERL